jgi:hypothetical protein
MLRLISTLILVSFSLTLLTSQTNPSRNNNFNIEALGSGLYYSINYERLVGLNEDWKLGFGIGLTPIYDKTFWNYKESNWHYNIPLRAHLLYDINAHSFLTGFDLTLYQEAQSAFSSDDESFHRVWFYKLGYRYSFLNNRLFVGVNAYLGFDYVESIDFWDTQPWGGVQFGYKF